MEAIPFLSWSPIYFRDLLKILRLGQAIGEFAKYLLAYRRLPPLGTGLMVRLKYWHGKGWSGPVACVSSVAKQKPGDSPRLAGAVGAAI